MDSRGKKSLCGQVLAIKAEKQGMGIGTAFLKELEEYVKSKQITHIFLQTERAVPAYKFYQKNGFMELKDHVSFVKESGII